MRESDVQKMISLWSDFLYLGERVRRNKFLHTEFTKEQSDGLKEKCIIIQNEIISKTSELKPDTFDFEFDPSIEDQINKDVTNTPVPVTDPAPPEPPIIEIIEEIDK